MIHDETALRALCGRLGEKIKAMLAVGISIEAIARDLADNLAQQPAPPEVVKTVSVRELTDCFACIDIQVGPIGASLGPLPRVKEWTATQVMLAMEKMTAGTPKCPGPHSHCPSCNQAELCFEGIDRAKVPPQGCCPHCGTFLVMDWPAAAAEPTFRIMTDEECMALSDDTRIQLLRDRVNVQHRNPRRH